MSGEPEVLLEAEGALATIILNRPRRRNGVTVAMCRQLYDVLREVAASEARVVILRGAGEDFSVGADIGGGPTDAPRLPPSLAELGDVFHATTLLHTMPQVTIAAIDGGCAGAAMGWAGACDLRFASAQARFNTAFLNVGVSGDMGLPWTLTRSVGAARARELLLFPAKFTAAEALAWGFVTRIFAREALHAEVRAAADQLLAHDPLALRLLKANLVSAEQPDLAAYIEVESARHLHSTARPDMAARMDAGRPRSAP
jgi:2-(1,2-epoxy-1,2-dihydrophenyl)acetyl-CoA isomerase